MMGSTKAFLLFVTVAGYSFIDGRTQKVCSSFSLHAPRVATKRALILLIISGKRFRTNQPGSGTSKTLGAGFTWQPPVTIPSRRTLLGLSEFRNLSHGKSFPIGLMVPKAGLVGECSICLSPHLTCCFSGSNYPRSSCSFGWVSLHF